MNKKNKKRQVVRLNESQLRGMIKRSVGKILNEYKYRFSDDKFDKWENETHIPDKIMNMISHIAEKVGCDISDEITITLRNRGGYPYAYGKGFSFSYRTSSYADGPDNDYSDELVNWIKGLNFKIENSFGDNGMDSATNWRDTWWTYEFLYEPSVTYIENFEESYGEEWDEDDEDDYDDYYDDDYGW